MTSKNYERLTLVFSEFFAFQLVQMMPFWTVSSMQLSPAEYYYHNFGHIYLEKHL